MLTLIVVKRVWHVQGWRAYRKGGNPEQLLDLFSKVYSNQFTVDTWLPPLDVPQVMAPTAEEAIRLYGGASLKHEAVLMWDGTKWSIESLTKETT